VSRHLRGQPRALPTWLREPLLHFLLIGAALFAADRLIAGNPDETRTIVVDAEVDKEARALFKASRGRDPGDAEMTALRRVWLDNEVLYREGMALQVDKGDPSIRERVIFKALSVIEAGMKPPTLDDKLLSAWFEKNRARYDEPVRFDFQEAVLAGDTGEAAAHAFAQALNAGTPGDAKAGLRVFKGRPHANLEQSYGEAFAKALEGAPQGEWVALSGREGWRVMRLMGVTAAKPADFETLRGVVLQDWTDATMVEQRTAAVRLLEKKYVIRHEVSAP
jgi:hypothetical protein